MYKYMCIYLNKAPLNTLKGGTTFDNLPLNPVTELLLNIMQTILTQCGWERKGYLAECWKDARIIYNTVACKQLTTSSTFEYHSHVEIVKMSRAIRTHVINCKDQSNAYKVEWRPCNDDASCNSATTYTNKNVDPWDNSYTIHTTKLVVTLYTHYLIREVSERLGPSKTTYQALSKSTAYPGPFPVPF